MGASHLLNVARGPMPWLANAASGATPGDADGALVSLLAQGTQELETHPASLGKVPIEDT